MAANDWVFSGGNAYETGMAESWFSPSTGQTSYTAPAPNLPAGWSNNPGFGALPYQVFAESMDYGAPLWALHPDQRRERLWEGGGGMHAQSGMPRFLLESEALERNKNPMWVDADPSGGNFTQVSTQYSPAGLTFPRGGGTALDQFMFEAFPQLAMMAMTYGTASAGAAGAGTGSAAAGGTAAETGTTAGVSGSAGGGFAMPAATAATPAQIAEWGLVEGAPGVFSQAGADQLSMASGFEGPGEMVDFSRGLQPFGGFSDLSNQNFFSMPSGVPEIDPTFGGAANPVGPGSWETSAPTELVDWRRRMRMAQLGLTGLSTFQGLRGARQMEQLARQAQNQQPQVIDPMGMGPRAQYLQQLNELMKNPGSIDKSPGYKAGLDAVQRSMASQGYLGSGNMMLALKDYGGKSFDQEVARLSQLAGVGMPLGVSRPDTSGQFAALQGKSNLMSQALATAGFGLRAFEAFL